MGTFLVLNKTIPAIGADGYGNTHQAIGFSDVQVTAWAKQFATYTSDIEDFIGEVATYMCAQLPSAKAIEYIVGRITAAYEWPTANDAVKVGKIREIVNTIMSLVDYQLA